MHIAFLAQRTHYSTYIHIEMNQWDNWPVIANSFISIDTGMGIEKAQDIIKARYIRNTTEVIIKKENCYNTM